MKLSVLTENCAGGRFGAEHGLSYFIETAETSLLFDTGHTDLFLRNAAKLGIDPQKDAKAVVLSHGHWDHGDGLAHLQGLPLITHPESFMKRYRRTDNSYLGLSLSREEAEARFQLDTAATPRRLSPDAWFLGTIPRVHGFEAHITSFVNEAGKMDPVPDDSALAILTPGGLVLVSGCAHAGICNTITHAMEVTGVQKVRAVIGGFHLKHRNGRLTSTTDFLKKLGIEDVLPSHCTDLPALCGFRETFGVNQVKTGMQFTW